ncbi:MAG: hypothetical protein K5930_06280 [Treponemataceae bacterium]|nr:hypothetical protein [Treponemataceae bacterium]
MNTKSFSFFVFFILIIFLTAVLYFGIALGYTISTNSSKLEERFSSLTGKLSSIVNDNNLYSNSTKTILEKELISDPYVSCITLSNKSSVFFAWPADSTQFIINKDGNPEILENSHILKKYTASIQTKANETITLTAALSSIIKADFYVISSRAFIIILAGTIFDFLLLIYLGLFSTKKEASSKEMENTLNDIEAEINNIASKKEAKKEEEKPQKAFTKNQNDEADDPSGLFSEKTGFGWESYIEPRLDAELVRAASNEMDLSLFIINIKNIEKNVSASQAVCQVLLKFFQYNDMIFEYGESGYAGILVNTDIDNAMIASETLYTELKEVFAENNCNPEFGIGLTSRSLRLMTGARLLNEAKKAAEKALEEKNLPIVAFRVNHEKSKQYLAEEAEKYSK